MTAPPSVKGSESDPVLEAGVFAARALTLKFNNGPEKRPLCANMSAHPECLGYTRAQPHQAFAPNCVVRVKRGGAITLRDGTNATYWIHAYDHEEWWA